ncbi:MFS transporter, LPLT family, lysophospholipid transporter [Methylomagnum ishizawai]|uniref:MFS transporter, LPLT family, lysophospholipid transporter n=1 Tax=Methylomagnum ishizawai TaxID=1760988 RepID=A0A1Y6CW94_9GAMM|nr:lysophospholipid transporter LplT [Methylomagnum ishizawai]SMF94520.1 MFS transporter, LPLT family, lysophospholipid transporter [Methylomagnum ishizawai]
MNRGLYALVGSQFLSAFADNAILFTVIAIVMQNKATPAWYIPALQSVFLIAYVVLTPWVGHLADRFPKPWILIAANAVKAVGGGLILVGVDPLFAYGVVGMGAAAYSPAKYGILPELTDTEHLVKANSWVEGATIAAILLGTVAGAKLADHSIDLGLWASVGLFLVSALAVLLLPKLAARGVSPGSPLGKLWGLIRGLLDTQRARLILLALSLFWACAATLRVALVAWAPAVLHSQTASDIAELTLYLSIGIVIGSGIVPRLIPLAQVRRVRFAGYGLGCAFLALAFVDSLWPARAALLGVGVFGGIMVVPLNAAIQQIGYRTVGSGSAVAVQNFFQNAAMLVSVGGYSLAAGHGAGPVATIFGLSGLVWLMTVLVSWRLPKQVAE